MMSINNACTVHRVHQQALAIARRRFSSTSQDTTNCASGIGEEADGGVCTGGEQPRLAGVERHAQHTLVVHPLVPAQDLHRHNQRVAQQILRPGHTRPVRTGALRYMTRDKHAHTLTNAQEAKQPLDVFPRRLRRLRRVNERQS